jgi:hypothetical protein
MILGLDIVLANSVALPRQSCQSMAWLAGSIAADSGRRTLEAAMSQQGKADFATV